MAMQPLPSQHPSAKKESEMATLPLPSWDPKKRGKKAQWLHNPYHLRDPKAVERNQNGSATLASSMAPKQRKKSKWLLYHCRLRTPKRGGAEGHVTSAVWGTLGDPKRVAKLDGNKTLPSRRSQLG